MEGFALPAEPVVWLVAACLVTVALRNGIALFQLVVAFFAFSRRIRPARRPIELWHRYPDLAPPVSVIAPCFNEELSIADSVRALLSLQYPDHEVIVVNDGSRDGTMDVLRREFELIADNRAPMAMLSDTPIHGVYSAPKYPGLFVIDKENGRKADAANAGISYATAPLVCIVDGDSIVESDALLRCTQPFMEDEQELVALGGAIRVVNGSPVRGGFVEQVAMPQGWLPRLQLLEYLRAFLTARVANAELNALLIISGAFGMFRRDVLVEVGGYQHDSLGEDFELITRIHRHMREQKRKYRIGFLPEVVCWTEVPFNYVGIRNQRTRWQQGGLQTLAKHRRMLLNPRYGRIGCFSLPLTVLEDVIGPPAELLGYVLIPVLWAMGILTAQTMVTFLALTVLIGTALSLGTLVLEETQLRRAPRARDLVTIALAAVIENFGYRQLILWFRLRGVWFYFRRSTGWAGVPRSGFTKRATP